MHHYFWFASNFEFTVKIQRWWLFYNILRSYKHKYTVNLSFSFSCFRLFCKNVFFYFSNRRNGKELCDTHIMLICDIFIGFGMCLLSINFNLSVFDFQQFHSSSSDLSIDASNGLFPRRKHFDVRRST